MSFHKYITFITQHIVIVIYCISTHMCLDTYSKFKGGGCLLKGVLNRGGSLLFSFTDPTLTEA